MDFLPLGTPFQWYSSFGTFLLPEDKDVLCVVDPGPVHLLRWISILELNRLLKYCRMQVNFGAQETIYRPSLASFAMYSLSLEASVLFPYVLSLFALVSARFYG